ncbi:MAG TPA: hypothetical protein VIG73_11815 [Cerasibacillus sp.]|uniref:hypothetical protein n=1 Tax=Cerasibacillus sp. TaxID=2498711 RepID=UPI002F420103
MVQRKNFIVVILVFIIILAVSCSKHTNNENGTTANEQIDKERAQEIALNDAPSFKPNNSNFEIYSIERTKMSYRGSIKLYDSWVVIISSREPNSDKSFPKILYQINAKNGKIIDKTNHAFGE